MWKLMMYDQQTDNRRQVMEKAHMDFGQVSLKWIVWEISLKANGMYLCVLHVILNQLIRESMVNHQTFKLDRPSWLIGRSTYSRVHTIGTIAISRDFLRDTFIRNNQYFFILAKPNNLHKIQTYLSFGNGLTLHFSRRNLTTVSLPSAAPTCKAVLPS